MSFFAREIDDAREAGDADQLLALGDMLINDESNSVEDFYFGCTAMSDGMNLLGNDGVGLAYLQIAMFLAGKAERSKADAGVAEVAAGGGAIGETAGRRARAFFAAQGR